MNRPKLVVVNTEMDEHSRSFWDGRGYRVDLSRNKLILYALSFVVSLCFMFILGIFAGRGVPVVRPDDFSMKGRFLRLLGLEKQTGQYFPKAAATWEDPKKMLESLNYYEDLTHKGGTPIDAAPKVIEPTLAIPVPEPAKEPEKRASTSREPAEKPSAPQPDKPRTAGLAAEQYTLLVASLRQPEAQVLIEKLRARGYSPRVESLDLGAATWTRILLGSFPSREAAIIFAAEFNSKENLQALVVSSSK
jgi:hypothetical protein